MLRNPDRLDLSPRAQAVLEGMRDAEREERGRLVAARARFAGACARVGWDKRFAPGGLETLARRVLGLADDEPLQVMDWDGAARLLPERMDGMGVKFAQMGGSFQAEGGRYERAADGMYRCRLVDVISEERPSYNDALMMEDKFVFIFETADVVNSEGAPFQFRTMCGTRYGNDKANLTKTINGMMGRALTQEEWMSLDTDDLMAVEYHVMVELNTSERGQYNNIIKIKPAAATRVAVVVPADVKDEIVADDPFGETPAPPVPRHHPTVVRAAQQARAAQVHPAARPAAGATRAAEQK